MDDIINANLMLNFFILTINLYIFFRLHGAIVKLINLKDYFENRDSLQVKRLINAHQFLIERLEQQTSISLKKIKENQDKFNNEVFGIYNKLLEENAKQSELIIDLNNQLAKYKKISRVRGEKIEKLKRKLKENDNDFV